MHESNTLAWRTSSYSGGNGACVEVAKTHGEAFFRDTKDRGIPAAVASAGAWGAFLQGVTAGTLGA
jgi:hypothetical protein